MNLDLFYSLKESTGRDSLIWSFLPQTQKRKPLELSYLLLGNSQELGTQSTLGKTPQLREGDRVLKVEISFSNSHLLILELLAGIIHRVRFIPLSW